MVTFEVSSPLKSESHQDLGNTEKCSLCLRQPATQVEMTPKQEGNIITVCFRKMTWAAVPRTASQGTLGTGGHSAVLALCLAGGKGRDAAREGQMPHGSPRHRCAFFYGRLSPIPCGCWKAVDDKQIKIVQK